MVPYGSYKITKIYKAYSLSNLFPFVFLLINYVIKSVSALWFKEYYNSSMIRIRDNWISIKTITILHLNVNNFLRSRDCREMNFLYVAIPHQNLCKGHTYLLQVCLSIHSLLVDTRQEWDKQTPNTKQCKIKKIFHFKYKGYCLFASFPNGPIIGMWKLRSSGSWSHIVVFSSHWKNKKY